MIQPKSFRVVSIKKHVMPYGFELVRQSLERHGHDVRAFAPGDKDGNLLLSIFWCEDVYEYIRWRKRNGIGDKYHVTIGGNHATACPNALVSFADDIYIGDGDEWDGENRTHVVSLDSVGPVDSCVCDIPERVVKMLAKSSTGRMLDIVEMTRGCKNKCLYCQYTWTKPWRIVDGHFIVDAIRGLNSKRVRLISANAPHHPYHTEIAEACRDSAVTNVTQDASLSTLSAMIQAGTEELSPLQRFGIDGMSGRLRASVNKPISTDDLVNLIVDMSRLGVRRIAAYQIFGLPSETYEDFIEYMDALRRIACEISEPLTIITYWNDFSPKALTPMQREASAWNRDIRSRREMMRVMDYGKEHGAQLYHMPMKTGNPLITRRMLAIRSTPATADLVYSAAVRKMPERQILKEFERIEGYHLHSERPVGCEMPWDRYVKYDSAKLAKIATRYRETCGREMACSSN